MPTRSEACGTALTNEKNAQKRLEKFWNLIYAVSVAFAASVIALIVAVLWGTDPAKAVTGIAAIASGGGVLFIVNMKNAAQKALKTAHSDVQHDCKRPTTRRLDSDGADYEDGLPDYAIDIITGASARTSGKT